MTHEPLDPSKTDLKSLLRSGTWLYNGQGHPWSVQDDPSEAVTQPVVDLGDMDFNTIDCLDSLSAEDDPLPFTMFPIPPDTLNSSSSLPSPTSPRSVTLFKRSLQILFVLGALVSVITLVLWQESRVREKLAVVTDPTIPPTVEPVQTPIAVPSISAFATAVESADRATLAMQTAETLVDWQTVTADWQIAIDALKSIPPSDPNYATAQNRIIDYRHNLNSASRQAQLLTAQAKQHSLQKDDEIFSLAVKQATQAAALTQTASTIAEWKAVSTHWQSAIQYMNDISVDSPHYAIAQDRLGVYSRNLSYAESKATPKKN